MDCILYSICKTIKVLKVWLGFGVLNKQPRNLVSE